MLVSYTMLCLWVDATWSEEVTLRKWLSFTRIRQHGIAMIPSNSFV